MASEYGDYPIVMLAAEIEKVSNPLDIEVEKHAKRSVNAPHGASLLAA